MKKRFALSVFAAVLVSACGQPEPEVLTLPQENKQELAEVAPNAESQFFVSGMTCVVGCKGAIEKELNKTAGIAAFSIVFEDSVATASYDSTLISQEEIATAIASVGGGTFYTATPLTH